MCSMHKFVLEGHLARKMVMLYRLWRTKRILCALLFRPKLISIFTTAASQVFFVRSHTLLGWFKELLLVQRTYICNDQVCKRKTKKKQFDFITVFIFETVNTAVCGERAQWNLLTNLNSFGKNSISVVFCFFYNLQLYLSDERTYAIALTCIYLVV